MGKAPVAAVDSVGSPLRSIPSVERLLSDIDALYRELLGPVPAGDLLRT